jgi:hypothetical protein
MIVPRSHVRHHPLAVERDALEALDTPASYPLLAPLGRLDRVPVSLGFFPSFEPYRTWALVQRQDGWFVRRVVWNRVGDYARGNINAPALFGSEAKLPTEEARTLTEKLSSLTVPLALPKRFGLDGTTSTLAIDNLFDAFTLEWWESGPPGWEGVARWHAEAVEFFEAHLPTTTFDAERRS